MQPSSNTILSPLNRPVYLMAKPAGAACNMRCDYCYYLEKAALTASSHNAATSKMSDSILEEYIKQYIEMQASDLVLFTWHGGEPMLRGLDFYKKVVRLQRRYSNGRHIDNALQTNGTLLNENWCHFLHDEQWLVGVSIDGPEELHDAHRLLPSGDQRRGCGSWRQVMRGIRLMQRFDVEWNAMATVNDLTASHPQAFYHFFRDIGCHYLQFTPVVERHKADGGLAMPNEIGELTSWSVNPQQWGHFLCEVYDEWVRHDVGNIFVQLFDATLACWAGVTPGVCTIAPTCGHAAVIEADGSVYSCDHFVFAQHRLGHLSDGLMKLLYSSRQQEFGNAKKGMLPRQCRQCQWLFTCNGECPRLRFAITADGESGLNYLCDGYRKYFNHVAPSMEFMHNELLNQRPPSNVMEWLARPRPY